MAEAPSGRQTQEKLDVKVVRRLFPGVYALRRIPRAVGGLKELASPKQSGE